MSILLYLNENLDLYRTFQMTRGQLKKSEILSMFNRDTAKLQIKKSTFRVKKK